MANVVITSDINRIYIVFNDYSIQAGMTSGDFQKSDCTTALNVGDIDVFFIVNGLFQWRFSYNSSPNSFIVDTIDGVSPSDNPDLQNLLQAALAVQTIPDQTGHAGEYLTTDGSDMSWSPVTGGSGLTQSQVLSRQL